MDDIVSYKNKLVDFGTRTGSFKNDKGETVEFTQLVAVVGIDGVDQEIVLSGTSAPKPTLLAMILRGADEV